MFIFTQKSSTKYIHFGAHYNKAPESRTPQHNILSFLRHYGRSANILQSTLDGIFRIGINWKFPSKDRRPTYFLPCIQFRSLTTKPSAQHNKHQQFGCLLTGDAHIYLLYVCFAPTYDNMLVMLRRAEHQQKMTQKWNKLRVGFLWRNKLHMNSGQPTYTTKENNQPKLANDRKYLNRNAEQEVEEKQWLIASFFLQLQVHCSTHRLHNTPSTSTIII